MVNTLGVKDPLRQGLRADVVVQSPMLAKPSGARIFPRAYMSTCSGPLTLLSTCKFFSNVALVALNVLMAVSVS